MVRLTSSQVSEKVDFIEKYADAKTPADGSAVDANANVTQKSAVMLQAELNKDINIQVNREVIRRRIADMYGEEMGKQYIKDIESHLIYVHDESSFLPYCVAISMYPFLLDGMMAFGGENASNAPTHLRSFCGSYVNLVQYVANNFAGAVATVEFLLYFDYFARKDFGDDYLETHEDVINQELLGVISQLNQESTARGGQSVFSNISTFDKYFFEGMFGGFVFPDYSKPNWDTLDKLQRHWHKWFREERKRNLLTFPVVTHCAISNDDGTDWKDKGSADFIAEEMEKGGEFFIYTSETADSLSSCCRLSNKIDENDFSYSTGAGGVSTGSVNVITMNVNRLLQTPGETIEGVTERIHKYQHAFYKHFENWISKGLLPVYTSGMIKLSDQFITVGVNGVIEGAEYLGIEPSADNPEYFNYLEHVLAPIKRMNTEFRKKHGIKANTEFVPAENLGVKNAKWDKKDGLFSPRDCYNSYMYLVEGNDNIIDKMIIHGRDTLKHLDGGSALHWNNDERSSKETYRKMLSNLIKTGSNYFCENVRKTCCNNCGVNTPNTYDKCPECGSEDIDYATRVIGYLKREKNFSKERRKEASERTYHGA